MFDQEEHKRDKAHVEEVLLWCDKHNIDKDLVIDWTIDFYNDCTSNKTLRRNCSIAYQYVVSQKNIKPWGLDWNGLTITK
jgi:hypothetical protein